MIGVTEVIMSFLFLPVTLFIIIPLVMLCGWLLFRLTLPMVSRREDAKKKNRLEEVITLTEPSKSAS